MPLTHIQLLERIRCICKASHTIKVDESDNAITYMHKLYNFMVNTPKEEYLIPWYVDGVLHWKSQQVKLEIAKESIHITLTKDGEDVYISTRKTRVKMCITTGTILSNYTEFLNNWKADCNHNINQVVDLIISELIV